MPQMIPQEPMPQRGRRRPAAVGDRVHSPSRTAACHLEAIRKPASWPGEDNERSIGRGAMKGAGPLGERHMPIENAYGQLYRRQHGTHVLDLSCYLSP